MKVKEIKIRNFRRLRDVSFSLHEEETVFVGPNNSGKTSAAHVFRKFIAQAKFSIHDFSIELLKEFDQWGLERAKPVEDLPSLPEIRLDVWFSIDSDNIPYAKLGDIVTSLSDDVTEIGIRCTYKVQDIERLREDYVKSIPTEHQTNTTKTLSEFLTNDSELNKHFAIQYETLTVHDNSALTNSLTTKEGKNLCKSLLRIDFVDAQRFLQDDETKASNRGSKLSSVFALFYSSNFGGVDPDKEAERIVEDHNSKLTEHYKTKFSDLMGVLRKLGFPSASERDLSVVSKLTTNEALRGTTDIEYIEYGSKHSLPEANNGLGTKNLILIATQLLDFQMQCSTTSEDQPQCHVIFIEEPEVHLHPQSQRSFSINMWSILEGLKTEHSIVPQLVITTHSSHIANSVEFDKIRYFRRCVLDTEENTELAKLTNTEIKNLAEFNVTADSADTMFSDSKEAKNFLERYMTLTYSDLLFADGAIFVEGTSERILLPEMINRFRPNLKSLHLSVMEVGGAHAHIFDDLMKFLDIPYLIVTDLDSVDSKTRKACYAAKKKAISSNPSIKNYFPNVKSINDLQEITRQEKIQESGKRFVTYQKRKDTQFNNSKLALLGRTFEEDLILANLEKCGVSGFLSSFKLPENIDEINRDVFEFVRKDIRKKTEFALNALADGCWNCPEYIEEGLDWLQERLGETSTTKEIHNG